MASKRKSVTFRENVTTIYSKNFDGSSSPLPIITTPANVAPPPSLDPMYLNWLRSATKVHHPFIVNGTFATHVYRQSFDDHVKIKTFAGLQKAQNREAAVSALARKYGSLGWGNLYREVSEQAWVKNYREIYRFDGSDEHLLEKMAEAYDQIKHAVAEEETAYAQFTMAEPSHGDPSARPWKPFTQGAGALVKPDLGPGGVNVTFNNATEAPFDEDRPARVGAKDQEGGDGDGTPYDMGGVVSRDFGDAVSHAGPWT